MKTPCILLSLLASLPAAAGTTQALVESPQTSAAEVSSWEVRTALYGWAQSLDGDVGIRSAVAPLDVPFRDIVEDLDMAFMGLVEAGRGDWSFLADLSYAKTSDSKGPLDYSQKQFVGNFLVIHDTLNTERTHLDLFAGARLNWVEADLTLGPLDFSADKTWVDPIIGARFQAELCERGFFRAVGDIGGFSISSDLTWQAMVGLGWRVMENGSLLLAYRGIGTDYDSGGFTYDVVGHGPLIGFEYQF
jgi:opacity protein-like surface antigen